MKMWNRLRKMMMVLAVMFCLGGAVAPAMTVYADTPAVQETQAVQTTGEDEDDGSFMLILGGGLLLIILFAVIAAVSTVSSAVAIAANMDIDGE